MKQEINNFSVKFNLHDGNINRLLQDAFSFTDTLYSFVAYNNKFNITINAHISQIDEYNTISIGVMITNILSSVSKDMRQGIFCYGQPPLPILINVLQPLIHRLALIQHRRWKRYLYDDLVQLCSCKLCELYNKGYYIHKALLKRTFENSIYQMLRKEPRDITFISSDAHVKSSDDTLSIADMILDTEKENEVYDKEESEMLDQLLTEQKELLIKILGERQYNQLLREFRTKTISNTTSRQIRALQKRLEKYGYGKEYWQKYFGG